MCVGGGGGGDGTNFLVGGGGGVEGRNFLCERTSKCDIAVPGNRACVVTIEWLLRASE